MKSEGEYLEFVKTLDVVKRYAASCYNNYVKAYNKYHEYNQKSEVHYYYLIEFHEHQVTFSHTIFDEIESVSIGSRFVYGHDAAMAEFINEEEDRLRKKQIYEDELIKKSEASREKAEKEELLRLIAKYGYPDISMP